MDARSDSEPRAPSGLHGRRAQWDALRSQVDAVLAGRGGIVLVTGAAGLGKSTLLNAAAGMAAEHGIRVFRGAGDVTAQVTPFGTLLEALASAPDAPVDQEALRELSQSPDPDFWVLREIQESLERTALRAPVLIAIDDMQRADAATLSALGALPRHLASHQILWLLAVRPGGLVTEARTALARLAAAGALTMTLAPLDDAAVAGVAQDVLGGVPDPALLKVLAGVQGHPFLLTELLRALRVENLVEADGGSVRRTGRRMSFRPVDSVSHQLRRLSPDARDALRMACVLGRRCSADELAALTDAISARLAGATPAPFTDATLATVRGALREALATGLIIEEGDLIAFRHDLVREAVDASMPGRFRERLRRQAIDVMRRHGAPPSDMMGLGGTSIAILWRAAAEAGQVSPAVASQLGRRALDLVPPDEPLPRRLATLTLAYVMRAGKAAEAVTLMMAIGEMEDPAVEAQARLDLARLSMLYSPADAVRQCERALERGVPAALLVQLLSVLSVGLDLAGNVSEAARWARAAAQAARAARASGDLDDEVVPLIPRATEALAGGQWRRALDLAGQAAAGPAIGPRPAVRAWMPDWWQALICIGVARLDEAFALIDAGMQAAQRDGAPASICAWSMLRSRALLCAGRLADARAEAEATIEMADELGDGSYGYAHDVARYILGRVALHAGGPAGLAQARQAAAQLGQPRRGAAQPWQARRAAAQPRQARGFVPSQRLGAWLMALAADADGHAALAAQAGALILDPLATGPLPATSLRMYADSAALTRILLQAGKRAEAAAVVARLDGFARQHPDFPFLDCAAVHARAVLQGDPRAAMRAVALSSADPRQLVRAAVLEDAGRLLPDARVAQAVPLLEAALASYVAAGAERDADRVRSLLRTRGAGPLATSPRPVPEWPELTESEFTVVSLVAQGATNREVAERLRLSPYTVTSHLRHAFSALGIQSRAELAQLAAERPAPEQRS